jgi:AP2 domain/HNH endonuclease
MSVAAEPVCLQLSNGSVALIDAIDYESVSQYTWYATKTRATGKLYAATHYSVNRVIYMHRFITGASEHEDVDHVNHDGLDNTRANLRKCTRTQNNANARKLAPASSQFKGVTWDAARSKWKAQIALNHLKINVGRFDSELEAATAYDAAAKRYFGEFANVNLR